MITVCRRLPLAAFMAATVSALAGPLEAASPELALAGGCSEVARPVDPILADVFHRTGPIDLPAAASPVVENARPVTVLAIAAVAPAGPVETVRSREQVAFLGDHRNLYRGPGSLVHTVRNVRPIPASEQTKPVVVEKQLVARRGPVKLAAIAMR